MSQIEQIFLDSISAVNSKRNEGKPPSLSASHTLMSMKLDNENTEMILEFI